MERQSSSFVGFLKGILIGGILGGTIALFTAPRSGSETRQLLLEKGEQLRDKTMETIDNTRKQVVDVIADTRQQVATAIADTQKPAEKMVQHTR